MMHYVDVIKGIRGVDEDAFDRARSRLHALAKPPGSLGSLEDMAMKLAAITGSDTPKIDKRCVMVLASDNGVVSEGVASAPQAVTTIQTKNIARGITGVGVIAKQFGVDMIVADVGVDADLSHAPDVHNRKIRRSTGNIAIEDAFSRHEAEQAIEVGIDLVRQAKENGYQLIGVGEMGIGNTTTSSAVLAGLLGLRGDAIQAIVGKGAGLDDAGHLRKIDVVQQALRRCEVKEDDPIAVLHKVGGLDLAAMTGVYLGAAFYRVPVVMDGFISIVAALCATRLNPLVRGYLFGSHHSYERGFGVALDALQDGATAFDVAGLLPSLHLNMRLGEGSGCPLLFAMLDASVAILKNMATFEEAQVGVEYFDEIKRIGKEAF